MNTSRLEAFSDGVLAIIITIMVLELKVPHETDWSALRELWPVFFSYILSFVYIGIYWNNHHHMFQLIDQVKGGVMWANLHLLFWLSLVPFVTGWMGENHFAKIPTLAYGIVLFKAGVTFWMLKNSAVKVQGDSSRLAKALGDDMKGRLSPLLYGAAIIICIWAPLLALALYVGVAVMWCVPEPRIEAELDGSTS